MGGKSRDPLVFRTTQYKVSTEKYWLKLHKLCSARPFVGWVGLGPGFYGLCQSLLITIELWF